MPIQREDANKQIFFAQRVIDTINNVKTPMLIYDEEKEVVKTALRKHIDELERYIRDK